jgi:transposase
MFIRCTKTSSRKSGEAYMTYRLVETFREGPSKAVKQRTILNLGAHFDVPQADWAALAARIDELVHGRSGFLEISSEIEAVAQRYVAEILARAGHEAEKSPAELVKQFCEVDLATLETVRPRSVGVEHAALSACHELGLPGKLTELGFNGPQVAAALGNIIGRIAVPASELATHGWLQQRTALGELVGYDYERLELQQLYRSADRLLKHRDALETHLFGAAQSLFALEETITLYDLTNTYFEGIAAGIPKAKRGRSKEKRSDCPLVTLGLVLDGSGFPRRSRIFEGNVSEAATLETMLTQLGAAAGAVVVMDAGIATEANLAWLTEKGYRYVVVSRKRERQFDPKLAISIKTAGDMPVQIQRVDDEETGETLLYCHSEARAQKDRGIDTKKAAAFEAALQKIADGLAKPRGAKDFGTIRERIGRIKEKYARAAQHYKIDVTKDESGHAVTAINWTKTPKSNSALTHPGVYCLRTTLVEPDSEALWRVYCMLTNLESVFRSLKTDLGLRPVYHQIERRVEGHLFISVLAYYIVHTMRMRLKADGIPDSWETIRNTLATQIRITSTLKLRDGRTAHVRKASRPEPRQQKIHAALRLTANPGGTIQTIV